MFPRIIPLSDNVFRVPTKSHAINSFFFVEDDGSVTIVDAGLKGSHDKILAALTSINRKPSDVRRILFTHSHDDHAGGAAKLVEALDGVELLAHKEEVGYLESGKNPPRDLSHFAGKFFRLTPEGGFTPVKIHTSFNDGDVLGIAGGLKVIHTPGHTPGHSSFLHLHSGTLITGDSIFNFGFRLAWSLSAFCTDFNQSKETAKKFLFEDFDSVAFTHGPHISVGGRRKLETFLS